MDGIYMGVDHWEHWKTPVRKLGRHTVHLFCGHTDTYTDRECEGGGPLTEERLPCPNGCRPCPECEGLGSYVIGSTLSPGWTEVGCDRCGGTGVKSKEKGSP